MVGPHELILAWSCLLLSVVACVSAPNAPPSIGPTAQPTVGITATASDGAGRTSPVPTTGSTATPESSCPPLTIEPPQVSHFDSVEGINALGYSDDGLALVLLESGLTVPIHPLTTLGLDGVDRAFAWSPDATEIAFLHTDSGSEYCARGFVMLAELSSGQVRLLLEKPGLYSRPVWSPDGQRLAFIEEAGELMVVQLRDGGLTTFCRDALGGVAPAWIDTEHVAYLRRTGDERLVDLVNQALEGSAPSTILADKLPFSEFAVSPDGRQLAYYGGTLILVDLGSGAKQYLGTEPSERLQWSPDGRYLLARGGLAGVYLVEPALSDVRQLDFLGLPGPTQQSWAPDSLQFAALLGTDGSARTTIGIYDLDRGILRELPIVVEPPYELAWSPR